MKIQKIKDVKTPCRGTAKSAGIDFFMPNDAKKIELAPSEDCLIPSGIIVQVPPGCCLIAFNKSGVATKKNLQVGACVVDEDYQGEIFIHLRNIGNGWETIEPGDKIVQFLLTPVLYRGIEVVDGPVHVELSERAAGGFGSTGVK